MVRYVADEPLSGLSRRRPQPYTKPKSNNVHKKENTTMNKLSSRPLAISSSFLTSPDEEVLMECRRCGIEYLELSIGGACPGLVVEEIQAYWTRLIASAKKAGIKLWSAHLSFWDPFDIASLDKDLQKKAVERQLEMMRFVRDNTDIKLFVLHPSFEPILPENRFEQMQISKKSICTLADFADSFGATIAVECLPRTCLGNSIDDMAKLISADSRLRICFDTNHLLGDTNEDFIKALGDRIATVHVSDYDRVDERHLMPYDGINSWKTIFSLLLRAGYEGPILFEVSGKKGYTLSDIKACYDKLCAEVG